jgi:PTH1 family peptidyl-tRNA hydrolase
MRLIVGLGNPGPEYARTPHNAGFMVCDVLAERHRFGPEARKFSSLLRRGRIGREDVALLKPQTYMNLSGDAVAEALRYMPVECEDILVVIDEMDLPLGKLRIRPSGGHGGHNGLRSIIDRLGTQAFPRLRLGVGRPPDGRSPTGHLLGKLSPDAHERLARATMRAAEAAESIVIDGVESAMNRFNGLPGLDAEKETT